MPPGSIPTPTPPEFLDAAERLGVSFDEGDLELLARFLDLRLDANRTTNLTAIRDRDAAWIKHILDALTLMPFLADLPEGASLIDVGSGGGVPGIPLAITCPHLRFALLEATGRKADFLRHAACELGLANVSVIQGRAEAIGQDRGREERGDRAAGHREAYDVVVARALGKLATVAELTVPLAKPTGRVLLIKGARADEELDAAAGALALLKARHAGTLRTPTGRIVVLEKNARTPRIYPRRDGLPKSSPL